jgi:hypothetical protein
MNTPEEQARQYADDKWFPAFKNGNHLTSDQYKHSKKDYLEGFLAGHSSALKDLGGADGWIACSERLPEERMLPVLIFNGNAPEYNQCVTQATWFRQEGTFKWNGKLLGTITHWMKLPDPPQENPLPSGPEEKTNTKV